MSLVGLGHSMRGRANRIRRRVSRTIAECHPLTLEDLQRAHRYITHLQDGRERARPSRRTPTFGSSQAGSPIAGLCSGGRPRRVASAQGGGSVSVIVSPLAQRILARPRAARWLTITAVLAGCAIAAAIHSYLSRRTIPAAPSARSLPLARGDVLVATAGEADSFGAPRRVRGMAIAGRPGESDSTLIESELAFLTAREWTRPSSTVRAGPQEQSRPTAVDTPGAIVTTQTSDASVWASFEIASSITAANYQEQDSRLYHSPAIAAALRAHRPVLLATLSNPSS